MSCRVCGESEVRAEHRVREAMFGTGEEFDYRECGACGSLSLAEIPGDLGRYYDGEDYYSFDEDFEARYRNPVKRKLRALAGRAAATGEGVVGRFLADAKPYAPYDVLRALGPGTLRPEARILDVGCGAGELLYVLRNSGFEHLLGIDPFRPEDRVFDNGLEIRRAGLPDLPREPAWDVVMFHHSFEHVPDPVETLAEVAARLAPGGVCILRLPTCSSRAWREYGPHWIQLEAPRHIFLPSREGLGILAGRSGLRLAGLRDDSTAFQFWGSEQARAGVPLFGPGSHAVDPAGSRFTPEEIRDFEARSVAANAAGEGDQVVATLRAEDARG